MLFFFLPPNRAKEKWNQPQARHWNSHHAWLRQSRCRHLTQTGMALSFERQGTTRNNPFMRRWCNRCNQSSDDTEYVKDEVYRCFAVWSITSCWLDVTDHTFIYRRLHQWTFSARQVRSNLDVFLTRLTPGTFTLQLFSVYVAFIKYWELAWHCANIMNSYRQYTLTKPACKAPMHTPGDRGGSDRCVIPGGRGIWPWGW